MPLPIESQESAQGTAPSLSSQATVGSGWRSSCQSDCPSCSSTTEQKAKPCAPSVCTVCPDLGFCRGFGPPDCEWFLFVALVVMVSNGRAVGGRGVTAQQRHLLFTAGSGLVRVGRVKANDIDWLPSRPKGKHIRLLRWSPRPWCIWAMIDRLIYKLELSFKRFLRLILTDECFNFAWCIFPSLIILQNIYLFWNTN